LALFYARHLGWQKEYKKCLFDCQAIKLMNAIQPNGQKIRRRLLFENTGYRGGLLDHFQASDSEDTRALGCKP